MTEFWELERQELLDMMEIIEDRHGLKSTIITSHIPFSKWYGIMSEAISIHHLKSICKGYDTMILSHI